MNLTGWTRLAVVCGVISAGSIGTTLYWGMKAADVGDTYKRYVGSLAPNWRSDADQMMVSVRMNNLRALEDQLRRSHYKLRPDTELDDLGPRLRGSDRRRHLDWARLSEASQPRRWSLTS
jgi:hypothetical protein